MTKIFIIIFATLFIPLPLFAAAPLVPENCIEGCPCSLCDLYNLARNVMDFLLFSVSVPIGAAVFLYGGVLLMTSGGSEDKLKRGRKTITGAVIGMALAFFAWAIMNVVLSVIGFKINFQGALKYWNQPPSCLSGGKETCTTKLPELPRPVPGEELPIPEGGLSEDEARQWLALYHISTKGQCPPGQTTGCVNLAGLSLDTIKKLGDIKSGCHCNVFLSGGTEGGHKSHGLDHPNTIDLAFDSNLPMTLRANGLADGFAEGKSFQTKSFTCEKKGEPGTPISCGSDPSQIDHIHVEF